MFPPGVLALPSPPFYGESLRTEHAGGATYLPVYVVYVSPPVPSLGEIFYSSLGKREILGINAQCKQLDFPVRVIRLIPL